MIKTDNEQNEANQQDQSATPVVRETFGSMMKAARESAGFSIERVAMSTRISAPFIEAMESERINLLPGTMFGRGFIRNLCKAYGKNPAEYLEGFERLIVQSKASEELAVGRDERRLQQLKKGVLLIQPNEWKGRFKSLAPHHYLQTKPLALIAAGLLVLVLGSSFLRSYNEKQDSRASIPRSEPVQEVEETYTPTTGPVQQLAEKVNEKTVATSVVAGAAVASNPPIRDAAGTFSVEMRVLEPVEVTVGRDQEKPSTEKLTVQTYHYGFQEQLKLYVENAAAVEVYFKGQRVGANVKKGEPKRFTFAGSDVEIAKKREAPKALR